MVDCEQLKKDTITELEIVFSHPASRAARRRQLSNTADETDYDAWEDGIRRALVANGEVVRKWAAHGE